MNFGLIPLVMCISFELIWCAYGISRIADALEKANSRESKEQS